MNKDNNYTAPYADIVEVNLKALMTWSGGERIISDPTGGATEAATTYPTDESKEW